MRRIGDGDEEEEEEEEEGSPNGYEHGQ